jgi:hypothetical protein
MTNEQIKAKLETTKIPFESITVLGQGHSINVATISEKSAKRWAGLFALMFPSAKIQVFASSWEQKKVKGGFGLPLIKGFRAVVTN